jgi:hypothetical protein
MLVRSSRRSRAPDRPGCETPAVTNAAPAGRTGSASPPVAATPVRHRDAAPAPDRGGRDRGVVWSRSKAAHLPVRVCQRKRTLDRSDGLWLRYDSPAHRPAPTTQATTGFSEPGRRAARARAASARGDGSINARVIMAVDMSIASIAGQRREITAPVASSARTAWPEIARTRRRRRRAPRARAAARRRASPARPGSTRSTPRPAQTSRLQQAIPL